MNASKPPTIFVLLGPTSSGKTDLILELSELINVEVLNCDSRQIYKDMPIGTAQPTAEILEKVNHHLVNFLPADQQFSAGQFRKKCDLLIPEILNRGNLPVVCGGTGFYYRSLSTQMLELPRNERLEQEISKMTHLERVQLLKQKDQRSVVEPGESAAAGRIHPNDQYRIERALLVLLQTGRPLRDYYESGFELRQDLNFVGFWLDVEFEKWKVAVTLRARQMIDLGMVAEAAGIRDQFGNCAALNTVGYLEALQCADKKISEQEFEEKLIGSHLQYGRHQRLWFRKQTNLPKFSKQEAVNYFQKELKSIIHS